MKWGLICRLIVRLSDFIPCLQTDFEISFTIVLCVEVFFIQTSLMLHLCPSAHHNRPSGDISMQFIQSSFCLQKKILVKRRYACSIFSLSAVAWRNMFKIKFALNIDYRTTLKPFVKMEYPDKALLKEVNYYHIQFS